MRFTAVAWNLYHGRDFPPDRALFTWRSRLLGIAERNATHVQVNRELRDEFAALLAAAEWDVALLQECPPRFAAPLARACRADAHRVLTSRNALSPLRQRAARLNPDLLASAEGGSNLTLVRRGAIAERRAVTIHRGRPERRTMALTRLGAGPAAGLCVANLHASANRPEAAAVDVLRAAAAAAEWAGTAPLLLGGDLNLRPDRSPAVFAELRERFGLSGETGPGEIDHLMSRGLEVLGPAAPWAPERREIRERGLALRLSDHAPVEATFGMP